MFSMFRRRELIIAITTFGLMLGMISATEELKPKVTIRKAGDGLFVGHVDGLWDQLLLHFAKYIKAKKSFTPEILEHHGIIEWDAFDETGGRALAQFLRVYKE